jgi:hypothetical protein
LKPDHRRYDLSPSGDDATQAARLVAVQGLRELGPEVRHERSVGATSSPIRAVEHVDIDGPDLSGGEHDDVAGAEGSRVR